MTTREPSIHITARRLSIILTEVMPVGVNILGLTKEILVRARPYSLNQRVVLTTTEKIEKKVGKILSSPSEDANLMARIIFMVRKKLKHVGITQIKPASKDWAQVKTITAQATEFCIDMDLPKKFGYTEYITIAFSKMVKPSLQKITSMHSAICETYIALEEIKKDKTPELTLKIHDYYRMKVASKTGLVNNFKNTPDKYVWFVRVAKLITELTVPLNTYLDAQFAAMDYRNALPDPSQLIGQKAKERLNKYMFENRIDLRKNGNNKRN